MTATTELIPGPGPSGHEPDWALSPSRAMDFKTCALLYRYRVIDKLPEPPSLDAARGTVVHGVLEKLFDLPAAGRTVAAAAELIEPEWRALLDEDPELAALVDTGGGACTDGTAGLVDLLTSTRGLLDSYFSLEDPRCLEPAEREVLVEATLASGVRLKGFVDRLDRSPAGDLRVVDYKTGKSPHEAYEGKALFQLRFYALALWRSTGVLPKLLRLYYLRNTEAIDYAPDERDLVGLERQLDALGQAISKARATGDWRHKPSKLCDWCAFHELCPQFGGTPPPLPSLGS